MTVYYNEQYRPIGRAETDTNDALSLRVQDLMRSINNAKANAMAPDIICGAWPLADDSGLVGQVRFTTQTEDLKLVFAPVRIPNGYDTIVAQCCGKMSAGSTGNCVVKLYIGPSIYRGAKTNITTADVQTMGSYVSSASFTIDETTSNVKATYTLNPIYDGGYLHCILTGACSAASEECDVMSLTASLRISSLT